MTNYKLAKLNDCNNDLKKHWYVEYQFLHPEKKEWIRFRLWISNKLKTAAARREKASELVKQTNLWLKNGGNPFSAENVRGKLVTEALDTVLEKKQSYCRPRTYHTYHHVIKLFKQFLVYRKKEKLILDEMNFPIAQDFLDWCIID
ncbi:MAG TPA: hypothetical protein VK172_04410, partial [Lentimicrobium sp.]|nr:hypothetical protein [Lentimicrobium sp.]